MLPVFTSRGGTDSIHSCGERAPGACVRRASACSSQNHAARDDALTCSHFSVCERSLGSAPGRTDCCGGCTATAAFVARPAAPVSALAATRDPLRAATLTRRRMMVRLKDSAPLFLFFFCPGQARSLLASSCSLLPHTDTYTPPPPVLRLACRERQLKQRGAMEELKKLQADAYYNIFKTMAVSEWPIPMLARARVERSCAVRAALPAHVTAPGRVALRLCARACRSARSLLPRCALA